MNGATQVLLISMQYILLYVVNMVISLVAYAACGAGVIICLSCEQFAMWIVSTEANTGSDEMDGLLEGSNLTHSLISAVEMDKNKKGSKSPKSKGHHTAHDHSAPGHSHGGERHVEDSGHGHDAGHG